MNTMMMRRVPGHGGCAAGCVPLSEAVAMPPFRTLNIEQGTSNIEEGTSKIEGKRVESKAWGVLEKRMARRDVEVGILSELAEERLMRSDWDGFRHVAGKAWRMKVHNVRVTMWMLRQQVEGGAA